MTPFNAVRCCRRGLTFSILDQRTARIFAPGQNIMSATIAQRTVLASVNLQLFLGMAIQTTASAYVDVPHLSQVRDVGAENIGHNPRTCIDKISACIVIPNALNWTHVVIVLGDLISIQNSCNLA